MKIYELKKPAAMELQEWGIDFHQLMLDDTVRMKSFKKAIFEVVKQGYVVCDLGTGTGVLAQWAIEAGAMRVYGIDFNQDILEIAKSKLASLGDAFIPVLGNSLEVKLPENVDLIINETIGNFADNENCVVYLQDAKQRFLKDGGRMMPSELKQMFVPVHSPALAQYIQEFGNKLNYYETIIPKEDYIAEPILVNKFTFDSNNHTEYEKEFFINVKQNKSITGFKGWFIAQLSSGEVIDTEEVVEDSSWNHFYFPIKEISTSEKIKIKVQKKNNEYDITCENV